MTEDVTYYLDFLGNRNGFFDVGDFYLYQNPAIPSATKPQAVPLQSDSPPAAQPHSTERRP